MNWFKKSLVDLFKTKDAKELLKNGMKPLPTTDAAIQRDINAIINYSNGPDYLAWEAEAWAQVMAQLSKILNEKTTPSEVDQARGSLRATLDCLRIAEMARKKQEEIKRKSESKNSTALRR